MGDHKSIPTLNEIERAARRATNGRLECTAALKLSQRRRISSRTKGRVAGSVRGEALVLASWDGHEWVWPDIPAEIAEIQHGLYKRPH